MHLNFQAKRVGKRDTSRGDAHAFGPARLRTTLSSKDPADFGVASDSPDRMCVRAMLARERNWRPSGTNGWLLARERERCLMILVCACLRRWQIRSRKSNSWHPCHVLRRPPCAARRNCCDHQPAARSSLASLLAVRACGPRPKPSQQPARQWTRNSARSSDAVCACLRS